MDGNFAINGVVFNPNHIVEIDFSADGHATIHMSSGNCRSLDGDDAARLRAHYNVGALELPAAQTNTTATTTESTPPVEEPAEEPKRKKRW